MSRSRAIATGAGTYGAYHLPPAPPRPLGSAQQVLAHRKVLAGYALVLLEAEPLDAPFLEHRSHVLIAVKVAVDGTISSLRDQVEGPPLRPVLGPQQQVAALRRPTRGSSDSSATRPGQTVEVHSVRLGRAANGTYRTRGHAL